MNRNTTAIKRPPKYASKQILEDSDEDVDETIRRDKLNIDDDEDDSDRDNGSDNSDADAADIETASELRRDKRVASDTDEEDGEAQRGHSANDERKGMASDDSEDGALAQGSDNDEEEEEHSPSRPKKSQRPKRKKSKSMFLDFEAAVDEDEEDEEEDDDQLAELGDDFIDEKEAQEARSAYTRLLSMHQSRDREAKDEIPFDPEAEEKRLKSLYGRTDSAAARAAAESGFMPEAFLAPTVTDPKLWMVKCKPGKEKDLVMSILRRYLDREHSNGPLAIKSALCREHLKGYIYVEAFKLSDVVAAVDKIMNLYSSRITLVPISEMTGILKVPKREIKARVGAWARVKRGKYTGDLAQIIEVNESTETARIKLLPRLDIFGPKLLGGELGQSDAAHASAARSTKAWTLANRPPQKLFNLKEVSEYSKNISRSKNYWIYNAEYFKDGYLEKEIKWVGLATENIQPSLDEIAKFSGLMDGQDIDLSDLPGIETGDQQRFFQGDIVEVIGGDLIKKLGTVESVGHGIASLSLLATGEGESVASQSHRVPVKYLRRFFKTGDHVKVIQGTYAGETGLIVQVQDNIVTLFSDVTKKQFQVFARDIREAAEATSTITSHGQYQVEDLVELDTTHAGVVVRVDKQMLRIMDQHGSIKDVPAAQIPSRGVSGRGQATGALSGVDANGNAIRPGQLVSLLFGEHSRCVGTVLHIYRSFVFVKLPNVFENQGLVAVRHSGVLLQGSRTAVAHGGAGIAPSSTSGGHQAFRRPMASPGGSRGRRDPMVSKTVIICGGPYKGKMGLVKEVDGSSLEIELHTNCRIISVDRSKVQVSDGPGSYIGLSSSGSAGSATPYYDSMGSRTPAGRTPGWEGGRTPGWEGSGGRTPGYEGARTPSHSGGWTSLEGNRTPGWIGGEGSRTPAYGADGGRTPSYGGDGATTPRATSGAGWTTPAAGPSSNAGPGARASVPEFGSAGWRTPAAAGVRGWESSATLSTVALSKDLMMPPKGKAAALDWPYYAGIEVTIQKSFSFQGASLEHDQKAMTLNTNARMIEGQKSAQIRLSHSGAVLWVPASCLVLSRPAKRDRVIVVSGEHCGLLGTLIELDRQEAVIAPDGGSDKFATVTIQHVAKLLC